MGLLDRLSLSTHRLRAEADTLSSALPALLLKAHKIANSIDMGQHGRRKTGKGEDFWQFKSYAQGDSRSEIDWRQSAKRGEVNIRQKELETSENVWFWLDQSPTMAYTSSPALTTKVDHARLLLMALAILLNRGDENFALLGKNERAAHGDTHLDRLTHALMTPELIPLHDSLKITHTGQYPQFIIVSDFLLPMDELTQMISTAVGDGANGVLLHIADPAEIALPFSGRTSFCDMSGQPVITFGKVETIKDDYRAAFNAHKQAVQAAAQKAGWQYHFCKTNTSPAETLALIYQYLHGRA